MIEIKDVNKTNIGIFSNVLVEAARNLDKLGMHMWDIKKLKPDVLLKEYKIEDMKLCYENNERIGLVSIDDHHDGEYKELSYQFIPDFWGKGYAYEVTRYMLRYAADKLDIKKIVSETQAANRASCGLLNKLGMKVMKKVYRFNAEQYIFLWEAE